MESAHKFHDTIDALLLNYDELEVLNSLLSLSLEDLPVNTLLLRTLELLTSIPWIALESKGSIFLVGDEPDLLEMQAQIRMESQVRVQCRRVPFGSCLCGLAASTQQIQFAAGIDDRHDTHYEGIHNHGHYCVPILFGDRVLGVMNLYLKPGHRESAKEAEFLATVANTLAGIIIRRESDGAYQRSQRDLELLITNVPAIVFKGSVEGFMELYDDKVMEMTGYPRRDFESRKLKWTDLILKEDADKARAEFIEAIKSRQPYTREYRIKCYDGKVIWIQERSQIVFNPQGRVAFISGILSDISKLKRGEEDLKQSFEKLRKILSAMVGALSSALEMRDPYTAGHQKRVAQLACAIGKELQFSEEQVECMRIIGLLHDIGKISVPTEILSKPGALNELEINIIRNHAEAGYNIIKDIEFPCPVAESILQHHERMDGSGYPRGLSGTDVLIQARIIGVADVVEAMSSHRPYRPGLGIEKALKEIGQNKGTLYDPAVVDICLKLFTQKDFKFE